jgi:hypothetical protein
MSGNQKKRVDQPSGFVQGPLVGELMLEAIKAEMMKERVFQLMYGDQGEHIFIHQLPNINETILPAVLLGWKEETYNSSDVYFEGSISGMLLLPIKLQGDYNALRKVGLIFQRFLGGSMNLFSGDNRVPGLIRVGYGTTFDYSHLAEFNGMQIPSIQMTIPFKFDLQLLEIAFPEIDFKAPLDDATLGWVEEYSLGIQGSPDQAELIETGILDITGQTN